MPWEGVGQGLLPGPPSDEAYEGLAEQSSQVREHDLRPQRDCVEVVFHDLHELSVSADWERRFGPRDWIVYPQALSDFTDDPEGLARMGLPAAIARTLDLGR